MLWASYELVPVYTGTLAYTSTKGPIFFWVHTCVTCVTELSMHASRVQIIASHVMFTRVTLKLLLNLGLRVLRANACALTTARVHVYEEAYFFSGCTILIVHHSLEGFL